MTEYMTEYITDIDIPDIYDLYKINQSDDIKSIKIDTLTYNFKYNDLKKFKMPDSFAKAEFITVIFRRMKTNKGKKEKTILHIPDFDRN